MSAPSAATSRVTSDDPLKGASRKPLRHGTIASRPMDFHHGLLVDPTNVHRVLQIPARTSHRPPRTLRVFPYPLSVRRVPQYLRVGPLAAPRRPVARTSSRESLAAVNRLRRPCQAQPVTSAARSDSLSGPSRRSCPPYVRAGFLKPRRNTGHAHTEDTPCRRTRQDFGNSPFDTA